jgi:hypothetical protein
VAVPLVFIPQVPPVNDPADMLAVAVPTAPATVLVHPQLDPHVMLTPEITGVTGPPLVTQVILSASTVVPVCVGGCGMLKVAYQPLLPPRDSRLTI